MCDTLISLPNASLDDYTIFGKNSDRLSDEVQLITHQPRRTHEEDEVECTYISIPQVKETYAVLLSQPWWMWGAEMGTNEFGVTIGNEAVYTKEKIRKTGLLGMDLLRLGLERCKTAECALDTIIDLLEKYNQGGNCAYNGKMLYHNSYIIADHQEAYVLETADKWWIVEEVKDVRAISNSLSIRGKGDMRREGIIQHAIENEYCKDDDDFDFAKTFAKSKVIGDNIPLTPRAVKSTELLTDAAGSITVDMMMEFLREHEAGICMHGAFESVGSQVSHLKSPEKKSIHWFTGSNRPCLSMYKPYTFPIQDQKVNPPGPYEKKDEDWFWIKHAKFIEPFKKQVNEKEKLTYMNEFDALERKIYLNIRDLVEQEENLKENNFMEEFNKINKDAWKKAYELIV